MPQPARRSAPAIEAALSAHDATPGSRRGEHLRDYSFRFDVDAAPGPYRVPRPNEGAAWTLAQTLQEVRLRGATLVVTSSGLRVRHAHLLADLAAAVRQHEAAVRLWVDFDCPTPRGAWDDATELHLQWLDARFRPGRGPIALRPGVSVIDWPRFRASVADRVSAGPDAPCASGLQRDLADLFERHAAVGTQALPERRRARAA